MLLYLKPIKKVIKITQTELLQGGHFMSNLVVHPLACNLLTLEITHALHYDERQIMVQSCSI